MNSTVPVRDLRNHTAEVLKQVRAGRSFTITQNGVPVAELGPLTAGAPISRADLLELLAFSRNDPDFAADIAALGDSTSDEVGPMGFEAARPLNRDLLPDSLVVSVVTLAELRAGVLAASDVAVQARRIGTLERAQRIAQLPVDQHVAAAW